MDRSTPSAASGSGSDVAAPSDTHKGLSRRSFLATGAAAGVGATLAPLGKGAEALAAGFGFSSPITRGDAAILRFLSAAEQIEADLWQQYNELGGVQDSQVPGGSGVAAYTAALANIDDDAPQYIHDNTQDEFTHFEFINAYLRSRGAAGVSLAPFAKLPSSKVTGAAKVGRLTNLMELTVDTSWYTRYRSATKNPDFGDTFAPAVPDLAKGKFSAIPRTNAELGNEDHVQALANTAMFHFGTIEQGGTSLYPSLAQRVSDPEVLRVLLSIGPTEAMHFQTWSDKAGNAPPLTDPTNGLVFPDLNSPPFGGEDFQTNLIMPEPTNFLSRRFPVVSIVRPTETRGVAMSVVNFLTAMGLFIGQSPAFFTTLTRLAQQADAAVRLH